MLCFGFKPINLSLNLLNQMSIVVIIINGASDKYPDTQYSCKLIYYAMQNAVFVLIKYKLTERRHNNALLRICWYECGQGSC